ncbi:unnamed protein product [Clavelina lepadiformis]|uniref:RING-type E3 ubiquitin transferase n=1 Tax=Clavelina lepadiformis TaxID=159417 RepID=A0ABP0GS50_CLALP
MTWFDWIVAFADERTVLESSALAVGSSISALFYFLYRRSEAKAKKVDDALALEVGSDLASIVRDAPFSCLQYVAINGRVASTKTFLTCQANNEIKGVVWKKVTTEHKDVWSKYGRTWQNADREISSYEDSIPFELIGDDQTASVNVIEPFQSSWFGDSMDVVHERFNPASESMMQSIVGFVSGDRLKGFTDTESMLRLGTKLCAIGELAYEDRTLKIRPPAEGDYIISKFTQKEIVSKMRGKATFWKVLALLLGAASLTGLYFMIRRLKARYEEMKKEQRIRDELNEIRQQRTAVSGRLNRDSTQNNDQELCLICLTNPRECVLLDCGHICLCVDCLEALPSPKECPVCRSRVARTVPLFHA